MSLQANMLASEEQSKMEVNGKAETVENGSGEPAVKKSKLQSLVRYQANFMQFYPFNLHFEYCLELLPKSV